jgi:O-antigen ligase
MFKNKYPWPVIVGPAVTLVTGFGFTWDPLNPVKLLVLSCFAAVALSQLIRKRLSLKTAGLSPLLVTSSLFLVGLSIPLLFADSPLSQQLYGVSGRNLGFFHYVFLTLILLGSAQISKKSTIDKFLSLLIITGSIESFIGISQHFGFDILSKSSQGFLISGTLGNSNYFSSFLAFSVIGLFFSLSKRRSITSTLGICSLIFLHLYAVIVSGATQGMVLILFGALAFFIYLIFLKSRLLGAGSLVFAVLACGFGVAGVLQKGPFAPYLYQPSVTFRGDYWRAGLNMFKHHWFTGVGLDSYGDYYRLFRDQTAASRRLTGSYPNSAHNLVLDLASTGGVILLIAYIATLVLVILDIAKVIRDKSEVNSSYVALVVTWVAFNLQSIISINVSSLAIWGWVSSGLLLGFRPNTSEIVVNSRLERRKGKIFSRVTSGPCLAICLLVITPLMLKDLSLASSSKSGVPSRISNSVLKFPRDPEQIDAMAEAYNGIGQEREALAMAQNAVKTNSRNFRGWEIIFRSSLASQGDREIALLNLSELDPFFTPPTVAP